VYPQFFLFRFCIWRGFKNESDVCHVLCEKLFMLDGRPDISKLMLKQSLLCITNAVSLQIFASTKSFLAFFKFVETVKDV